MKKFWKRIVVVACLLALMALALPWDGRWQDRAANAEEAGPQPAVDVSKRRVEAPLEKAIARQQLAGTTKLLIERPVESVIAPADRGKFDIEAATKLVIGQPENLRQKRFDSPKGFIELSVEQLVEQSSPPTNNQPHTEQENAEEDMAHQSRASNNDPTNPKVEPGKVDWHADFETACKVSATSGKPVLLFHLLGQLDQRFT